MSWTAPRTWVTGEIVTAALLNTHLRDNLNALEASGTSFPGSPTDGTRYVYAADTTNGIFWHFRYYGASSYWAFIGGPPLWAEVNGVNESSASTTYVALTTAGPSVTLPFAGDYDVEIQAELTNTTNGAESWASYDIGGTGAVDADGTRITGDNAAAVWAVRRKRKTGLSAVALTMKYRCSAGNVFRYSASISVWPVKK